MHFVCFIKSLRSHIYLSFTLLFNWYATLFFYFVLWHLSYCSWLCPANIQSKNSLPVSCTECLSFSSLRKEWPEGRNNPLFRFKFFLWFGNWPCSFRPKQTAVSLCCLGSSEPGETGSELSGENPIHSEVRNTFRNSLSSLCRSFLLCFSSLVCITSTRVRPKYSNSYEVSSFPFFLRLYATRSYEGRR